MLNQTNIENNNNKFYLIQLVVGDGMFSVWTAWGRVGREKGTGSGKFQSLESCIGLEHAKTFFKEKFKSKTSNTWLDKNFVPKKGKYIQIHIDHTVEGEEDEEEEEVVKEVMKKIVPSSLKAEVQSLIRTLFDQKMMNKQMIEIGYDADKAPLGKLSQTTILEGYKILQRISDVINGISKEKLSDLSSLFYTYVPHDFGYKSIRGGTTISTLPQVKTKLDMLASLSEIKVAMNILDHKKGKDMNEIDYYYSSLNCQIEPVSREKSVYKLIEQYTYETHGPTHTQWALKVEQIYAVERKEERERFESLKEKPHFKGKSMLLWHGSRLTNFIGILSQGLRIAPPEAPSTGYMFGKGVYFADVSSKSAQYCFVNPGNSDNFGYMLLCEVLVGDSYEIKAADYHANQHLETKKKHSTKGVGKFQPASHTHVKIDESITVPIGKVQNKHEHSDSDLLYNDSSTMCVSSESAI